MCRLNKCTGGSMDRASDSGSEGWGFESLPVYQNKQEGYPFGYPSCLFGASRRKGLERAAQPMAGQKLRASEQFLARGRVHRRKTASGMDVGFLLFLFAGVSWTSTAGEGWTEPNLYFLSQLREKMQTSPFRDFPTEQPRKGSTTTGGVKIESRRAIFSPWESP